MTPRLTSLLGNRQRLDGGAMFGNVPRALWSQWLPPDEHHRVPLACRCLLIEHQGTNILCETGIGAFFPPDLRARFGVDEPEHVLLDALASHDLGHEDIDIVVLSHLHFDHAGGLLAPYSVDEPPRLLFPNARYLVGSAAWARAIRPHRRDRASFISELQDLLRDSGRLQLIDPDDPSPLGPKFRFHLSHGHTPGLMLLELETAAGPVVFAGDLIPGVPWVHLPITMGYDRCPEQLIDEKEALLTDLLQRGGHLFFTHDPSTAMGKVSRDERGRFTVVDCHQTLESWTP